MPVITLGAEVLRRAPCTEVEGFLCAIGTSLRSMSVPEGHACVTVVCAVRVYASQFPFQLVDTS